MDTEAKRAQVSATHSVETQYLASLNATAVHNPNSAKQSQSHDWWGPGFAETQDVASLQNGHATCAAVTYSAKQSQLARRLGREVPGGIVRNKANYRGRLALAADGDRQRGPVRPPVLTARNVRSRRRWIRCFQTSVGVV